MPRNLKITLTYDGSDFSGWQVQPGLQTVQGALSDVIRRTTGEKVLPQGSGRTDTGVHALAQVATFVTDSTIPLDNLKIIFNDRLPPSVRVLQVEEAAPHFHARHSAKAKTYRYHLYRGTVCPPFLWRYVAHYPYPLDETRMFEAAGNVLGEHDFTSFAAVDPDRTTREPDGNSTLAIKRATNVRTIFDSHWQRSGDELVYTVRGNGFLHHMVRNFVGTFLLVGKGTCSPENIKRILDARDRSAAGPTAAASGLYLVSVEY